MYSRPEVGGITGCIAIAKQPCNNNISSMVIVSLSR